MLKVTILARACLHSGAVMTLILVAGPHFLDAERGRAPSSDLSGSTIVDPLSPEPDATDDAVEALPETANNPGEVRQVVHGMGSAAHRAVPELRRIALESPAPLVAGNAVRALSRLGALTGDAQISELLSDPRLRVRQELVMALGSSKDPSALDELATLLGSEEASLRALAIQAIGRIGGERAREVLRAAQTRESCSEIEETFLREALAACR